MFDSDILDRIDVEKEKEYLILNSSSITMNGFIEIDLEKMRKIDITEEQKVKIINDIAEVLKYVGKYL